MHAPLGEALSIWWTIPFAGMLLSIALFPLFAPRFWHHHYPKVVLSWAVVLAVPFLYEHRGAALDEIAHVMLGDYVPFLVLLWALYTVASGILVTGTMRGTPAQLVVILAAGTALASWIGTTGASMVLIRPLLRAIEHRRRREHIVVFFIFLVSNIGGALTPLGDPPLFLGFLHHVPFFWTLRLLPAMLLVSVPLLLIFYVMDTRIYQREDVRAAPVATTAIGIHGWRNFACLGVVVGAVLMSGIWKAGMVRVLGVELPVAGLARDAILMVTGWVSLWTTASAVRAANQFSWGPVREVAILFAGIFLTIVPALAILKAGEHGALRSLIALAESPPSYFWLTGGLSSFLDNAPTYLTFLNTALGALYPGVPESEAVGGLVHMQRHYLQAISCGAVFMGANTYIGNAPNFMVKSIAEDAGIEMPSFFGYIFRYTIPFLIPLFLLVTFVFFR